MMTAGAGAAWMIAYCVLLVYGIPQLFLDESSLFLLSILVGIHCGVLVGYGLGKELFKAIEELMP